MILTVARNVAGLFVNKDKRVIDLMEQRLLNYQIDTRARRRAAKADWAATMRDKKSSGDIQRAHDAWIKAEAQCETVESLLKDFEAILIRVHAGA
ncbi:hypothetical protein SEA_DIABLA_62 [Gordonia phage Diabla]|nr:hypothetical protein SEA_DIABLA_62 [Gordonia phage Diabla]